MRFKFSLQKVLELREREENEAQSQVDLSRKKIIQIKQVLEEERLKYFSHRDQLNVAIQKTQLHEIELYENSLSHCQERMMTLLATLRDIQNDLDLQETVLIKAKKNKKMVEKLYEMKVQEFAIKEKIKEQNLMDELAIQKFYQAQQRDDNDD